MRRRALAGLPDVLPIGPYFRELVWGGRRLQELYGKDLPAEKRIGESFELSAYAERESVVAAGRLAGRDLRGLIAEFREQLVGRPVWERYDGRFPLLIKLLDAQQDLSIQVHPDDAYAQANGLEDTGKMEAWFVLHSEEGRVAYGLKPGVDREQFAAASGSKEIEALIQFHPARPGDVLFMPPGMVHALCQGVVIYEVQQSSDLTYRIYDYGRLGLDGQPRQLHVQEALAVIDFDTQMGGPTPWRELPGAQEDRAVLVDCEHFELDLYRSESGETRHAAGDSFLALTLVEGEGMTKGGEEFPLRSGDTVLVPSGREFAIEPQGEGACTYLIASVPVE